MYSMTREEYLKRYICKLCGILEIDMPQNIILHPDHPCAAASAMYLLKNDTVECYYNATTIEHAFFELTRVLRQKWQCDRAEVMGKNRDEYMFTYDGAIDSRAFATASAEVFHFKTITYPDQNMDTTHKIQIKASEILEHYFGAKMYFARKY